MKVEWERDMNRWMKVNGLTREAVRNDIWAILDHAQDEVPAVLQALNEGRIDGMLYNPMTDGGCCCLIGTIAVARHTRYDRLPGIEPLACRSAETFFCEINPHDTPENHPFARLAWEWILEYQLRLTSPE